VYNEFLGFQFFSYGIVGDLGEPTFRKVGTSSFAHLIEKNELHLFLGIPGSAHIEVCAHRKDPLPGILISSGEIFQKTSLYVYKDSSGRHVFVVVQENIRVFRTVVGIRRVRVGRRVTRRITGSCQGPLKGLGVG